MKKAIKRKLFKFYRIATALLSFRIFGFLKDYYKFKAFRNNRFRLSPFDFYPLMREKTPNTAFDSHYVYHTSWAARKVKEINPTRHTDISSSLYFCGLVSAFIPVDFYDYRPAGLNLSGLTSASADLTKLSFADNSIPSLSCMHTIEHVGLGRYGDPIDPQGDLIAINELKRVVAIGGSILFVVPVGVPRIEYNAHRIYSFEMIQEYFSGLKLKEFSLINDYGKYITNADPALVKEQKYACGCFWFIKEENMDNIKTNISLPDLTRMIENGENFAFTKFGDGEVSCMRRWFGKNCDGDTYHRSLGRSLKESFVDLANRQNVYIGRWHNEDLVSYLEKMADKKGIKNINWVDYHFILNASPVEGITNFDSFSNDKMFKFAQALQKTNRKKILFTNGDNKKLKEFFRADIFVETKKNNWSYEFDEYYQRVEKECVDNAILIIAAGLSSKVLITKLLHKFNMTCIDIGSGFDLLATGKHSRPWSHSYQDELNYYKDILPEKW